jgi:excisionase family DNA binding protein
MRAQHTTGLPTLIDIATAAEHLGVTVRHVRRLVAEKRIPYIKVGHFVRFDPAEVAAWIDRQWVDGPPARWAAR